MMEPKFSIFVSKNKIQELENELEKASDNDQKRKTKLKHHINDLQFSIIQKCNICNKDRCTFNSYRGKKDPITGFYVAHIDKNNINNCTIYCGFLK